MIHVSNRIPLLFPDVGPVSWFHVNISVCITSMKLSRIFHLFAIRRKNYEIIHRVGIVGSASHYMGCSRQAHFPPFAVDGEFSLLRRRSSKLWYTRRKKDT